MLYLRTFGGISLLGGPSTHGGAGTQRKPLALLAMVAAAGPLGMTRDQLLAYLWPERDEEHGRPALRQVLHALRRDLAAPALFLPGGDLRLNPEVIGSDIGELNDASAEGDIATIARLYKGPFLEGFHLPEAPEFEHWVERERRLRLSEVE